MVSFKDEASLGQVIEKKLIYSFGAAPITLFKELVFAAGGNKFSSLCGFKFISKAQSDYREFFISFVCKLRSKIYRQASTNPSQWFIFKKINKKELHCMDKKTMLALYGFDVDLFFKSDLFQKGIEKFKQAVTKGLKEYVPAYVKAHGAEKAKDLLTSYDGQNDATVADAYGRYAKAIEESLEYIGDLRCNDKFYKLIDYDITVEKEGNEVVQEASFECVVKKDKDGWGVYEKEGNTWVATFHDEIAANEFAKEYPTLKAEYLKKAAAIEAEDSLVEDDSKEVNEATVDHTDPEEITIKTMLEQARKLYPNNRDGGMTSPIVGIVDGHLADFTAFTFAKHEGHPDPGTFFLHDGSKASVNALAELLEVGQYNEAEDKVDPEVEEAEREEKELDANIEEALKEIYN